MTQSDIFLIFPHIEDNRNHIYRTALCNYKREAQQQRHKGPEQ